MTITAASSEVLVSQFAEGDDLNDGLRVGPWLNGELIASGFTEDNHVSLSLTADQELTLFSSDLHRVQRFMRFNCVGHALSEFIPDLQRVVQARRDELIVIHADDARNFILMSRSGLEVTLTNDNILVDGGLHFLGGLGISLDFFVVSCWI